MSAPHVSGAAALILQKNQELAPSDVKHLLEETSVDLGPPGRDTSYGSGMIDLKSALNFYSGIEFTVSFKKQLPAGSAQQVEVRIFDDIPITGVSGKVKKPDNSEKSFALNP